MWEGVGGASINVHNMQQQDKHIRRKPENIWQEKVWFPYLKHTYLFKCTNQESPTTPSQHLLPLPPPPSLRVSRRLVLLVGSFVSVVQPGRCRPSGQRSWSGSLLLPILRPGRRLENNLLLQWGDAPPPPRPICPGDTDGGEVFVEHHFQHCFQCSRHFIFIICTTFGASFIQYVSNIWGVIYLTLFTCYAHRVFNIFPMHQASNIFPVSQSSTFQHFPMFLGIIVWTCFQFVLGIMLSTFF